MALLADTLSWALDAELAPLAAAVGRASTGPLAAIGSGGSLSTAHALAYLHRSRTGHLAAVLTPYEAASTPLQRANAVWLLSASGNNVDIVNAIKAVVTREHRQMAALVGRENSKVGNLLAQHPYADVLTYSGPAGKDGFLATNSLLGAVTLLTRAYTTDGATDALSSSGVRGLLMQAADVESALVGQWRQDSATLWDAGTLIVLHGADSAVGAVDLESKFTEAALGQVQVADYRNFAHGRHHWIAKHPDTTAVLALVADADADIADRTLRLLPSSVPVVKLSLPGSGGRAALLSLLAAFHLTRWAGQARGIDPGDPGVPPFGRRLFHLAPGRPGTATRPHVNAHVAAAIERKAGQPLQHLATAGTLPNWTQAYKAFRRALLRSRFTSVVFDYDGTLVDTSARYQPPRPEIVAELVRLLRGGVRVGIATGRGGSVSKDLREVLPRELHHLVLVGYYNGSEISDLTVTSCPDSNAPRHPDLVEAEQLLRAHPDLAGIADPETRANQLTVTMRQAYDETRLWRIVDTLIASRVPKLRVIRSSHSIDVVTPQASKLHVVDRLRSLGTGDVLAIGDRGERPGNDHELLSVPIALSADECSTDPSSCWNLGSPGQRGTAVTLEYLRALTVDDTGRAFFTSGGLR
ncbi:hypothetical protein [Cellulomonas sp. URHB0016]